jgi:hypothetical protein
MNSSRRSFAWTAFLWTVLIAVPGTAQPWPFIHVMIGAGVDGHIAPSFVDQVNAFTKPVESARLGSVATAIDLTIGGEYQVTPHWTAGIEYGFLSTSHTVTGDAATYDYRYTVHMPTALVHYVVVGRSYLLSFGGGLGWHLASATQTWSGLPTDLTATANGPAVKLDASVGVPFLRGWSVTAGAELRGDLLGNLRMPNGNPPTPHGDAVNLNFASFGLRLGLMYAVR